MKIQTVFRLENYKIKHKYMQNKLFINLRNLIINNMNSFINAIKRTLERNNIRLISHRLDSVAWLLKNKDVFLLCKNLYRHLPFPTFICFKRINRGHKSIDIIFISIQCLRYTLYTSQLHRNTNSIFFLFT